VTPPRIRVVDSTMGRPGYMPERAYRWRGKPGWNPAAMAPMPAPAKGGSNANRATTYRARLSQFFLLRELGMSVPAASARLGVTRERGGQYERMRQAGQ
jgi:hypothetical protein